MLGRTAAQTSRGIARSSEDMILVRKNGAAAYGTLLSRARYRERATPTTLPQPIAAIPADETAQRQLLADPSAPIGSVAPPREGPDV